MSGLASAERDTEPLHVAIVSHREIVYRGVVTILADDPERYVVTVMPSVRTLSPQVDVVLYDLSLIAVTGGSELAVLVERSGGRVLALANGPGSGMVRSALEHGVAGCIALDANPAELGEALGRVAAGQRLAGRPGPESLLSKREAEILRMACDGLSNAEIANALFISPNTLKSHIRSAYQKLGVHSRSQAVMWVSRNGLAERD